MTAGSGSLPGNTNINRVNEKRMFWLFFVFVFSEFKADPHVRAGENEVSFIKWKELQQAIFLVLYDVWLKTEKKDTKPENVGSSGAVYVLSENGFNSKRNNNSISEKTLARFILQQNKPRKCTEVRGSAHVSQNCGFAESVRV